MIGAKRKELKTRTRFEVCPARHSSSVPIFPEFFVFSPVVSFNCLRAKYAFNHNTYTKEEWRPFDFRVKLLARLFEEELADSDFLCLQEIEDVSMFSFLDTNFGFVAGGHDKNQHSFTKPRVFFRKDRFKLVWQNQRSRAVLAQFEMIEQARDVFVVSVHLQGGPKAEQDRENQINNIVRILRGQIEKLSEGLSSGLVLFLLSGCSVLLFNPLCVRRETSSMWCNCRGRF